MENNYLTDIPQEYEEKGFAKVLLVRHEIIHLKHILTEIFVRKTINVRNKFQTAENKFSPRQVINPTKLFTNEENQRFTPLQFMSRCIEYLVKCTDIYICIKKTSSVI